MASDCQGTIDHCVQLVGYDMTAQPTTFWSVRNSWGTDWGESGYIRLQYGQDTCSCADEVTTAVI
jgi:C1A family cysteine protease